MFTSVTNLCYANFFCIKIGSWRVGTLLFWDEYCEGPGVQRDWEGGSLEINEC